MAHFEHTIQILDMVLYYDQQESPQFKIQFMDQIDKKILKSHKIKRKHKQVCNSYDFVGECIDENEVFV